MMSNNIMQHIGALKADEKVTRKAELNFINHAKNISTNGKPDLPFTCYEGQKNPHAAQFNLENEAANPDFYKTWVRGIYAEVLKMLNLSSNIALPIFDPMALPSAFPGAGLKVPNPPMSLEEILTFIALPETPDKKVQLALVKCGVGPDDLTKLTELSTRILTTTDVIKPPALPKLPSFEIPPGFELFPGYTEFDTQKRVYQAILDAFQKLLQSFSDPSKILDLAIKGPSGFNAVFSETCKLLNEALPPPPGGSGSTSTITNQAATVASVVKPMTLAVFGSLIGSHPNGLTGTVAKLDPDPLDDQELPEINQEVVPNVPVEEESGTTVPPTSLSEKGVDFITTMEGFTAYAVEDPPNQDKSKPPIKYSIGYGHQIQPSDPYKVGVPITRQQAREQFKKDVKFLENLVNKKIKPPIPLTQNQYDTVISFVYNSGPAKLDGYFGKQLNAGNYGLLLYFIRNSTATTTGETLKVLEKRRKFEIAIWEKGDYSTPGFAKPE